MKRTIVAAMTAVQIFAAGAGAQTPASLPSGRDLLVKSLHVTGADTILPKHKSMTMTGTLAVPAASITGPLVMQRMNGAFHVAIDIPEAGGMIEQGYADSTAWSINPATGPALVTGTSALTSKRQAVWLDGPDLYTTMTTESQEKFVGKDAYKVSLVTKDGAKLTRYYEVATGLLLGWVSHQETEAGDIEITTTVSDYRNFDGMLFAMKQVQSVGGTDQEITMEKIVFDNVTPDQVALPASIKALKK